jgi:hypothetical protein
MYGMITLTWFIIDLGKVERDTYKCMAWFSLLSLSLVLYKGEERHTKMYDMVILAWFIIGLDEGGEVHMQMHLRLPLLCLLLVMRNVERDTYMCMAYFGSE